MRRFCENEECVNKARIGRYEVEDGTPYLSFPVLDGVTNSFEPINVEYIDRVEVVINCERKYWCKDCAVKAFGEAG